MAGWAVVEHAVVVEAEEEAEHAVVVVGIAVAAVGLVGAAVAAVVA